MLIGLADADLLDKGTRFPNLALMKMSGYFKAQGHTVELLTDYKSLDRYDKVYLSKVFSSTKVPEDVLARVSYGGTGFYFDKAPPLPFYIEHHSPDYSLYLPYIQEQIRKGKKESYFNDYLHYSVGFTTRGCFRKCSFCVNKNYDRVIPHSPIDEFVSKDRKYIYLLDDNILAYEKWREVFDQLEATGKPFCFKQGMDIRLLSEDKARVISQSHYHGDFTFAFDDIKDKELIERKLILWRKYASPSKRNTRFYVLVAYNSQDENDIASAFERIKLLMKYQCLPYIMRYKSWSTSKYRGMYVTLARWCNQPSFFKKYSFREFCCEAEGQAQSALRYMREFEKEHPDLASKYFDLSFKKGGS